MTTPSCARLWSTLCGPLVSRRFSAFTPGTSRYHVAIPNIAAEEIGVDTILSWTQDAFVAPVQRRVPRPVEIVNVGAVLPAANPLRAKEAVVVTGHYDSRRSDVLDATGDAPGANDDASGTALVCPISLHPHVSGQPHRLRQLRRALAHIAQHRTRIWAARAGDIADVAIQGYGIG